MKKIDPVVLRNLCEATVINPRFKPTWVEKLLRTFCNYGLQLIAGAFGLRLKGRANKIIKEMRKSPNWRQVDFYDAARFANQGALVVAVREGILVGHVAVCCPGKPVWSGKWGIDCPICGNVGKDNWDPLRGINWAFTKIPDIYVWDDSVIDKYSSGLRPKGTGGLD